MSISSRAAIRAAVAYADIFDYPLTRQQLRTWMVLDTYAPRLVGGIESRRGYFFLKGRHALVNVRLRRAQWQDEKWDIARRAAHILSRVPTILLVGVTGGLAMNNAKREDDIDLFLIVSDGTMWISRLFATLLMDLFGLRRHPRETSVTNKICLNMFVTERGMGVPDAERDLFAAHEVLQMQPLVTRGSAYKRFLQANAWVHAFLPTAWAYKSKL